jgi:hypothetical protein
MQHAPRVIVGAVQYTPDDPLPSPFIAVSYPNREEAKSAARLVLSLQNGTRPLESGPHDVYVGDTKVKSVYVRRKAMFSLKSLRMPSRPT